MKNKNTYRFIYFRPRKTALGGSGSDGAVSGDSGPGAVAPAPTPPSRPAAAPATPAAAPATPAAAPGLPENDARRRERRLESIKSSEDAREAIRERLPSIDRARMDNRIVAASWHLTSAPAIETMFKHWDMLRLPVHSPFYQKVKAQLLRPFTDPSITGKPLDQPGSLDYYRNPTKQEHYQYLSSTEEGREFLNAYEFYQFVKKTLMDQLQSREAILKRRRLAKSDPVFRQITGALNNVWNDAGRAFRERDLGTIGLYAVTAWSIIRIGKKLKEKGDGKYLDYLAYAAAAYGGYHLLNKAGLDLGKKLGLVDRNADVKGTVHDHIVSCGLDGSGAIEGAMMMALSTVSVKKVYSLYQNAGASEFIHPDQIPSVFSGLAPFKPLDINNPKTANEELYVQTGKNLYALMASLVGIYAQLGGQKKTFEERFINTGEDYDFTTLSGYYAQFLSPENRETYGPKGDRLALARKELGQVLEGKVNYTLDESTEGGHVRGSIFGFPVVFIRQGEKDTARYQLKFADDYERNAATTIGEIPLKAGSPINVRLDQIEMKVYAKMDELLKPFGLQQGYSYSGLDFNGNNWECMTTMPGLTAFGYDESVTVRTSFFPLPNGRGVEVQFEGKERMPFNWFLELGQHPHLGTVVHDVVYSSEEARTALSPFVRSGQIQFEESGTHADNKFQLIVANLADTPLDVEVVLIRDTAGQIINRRYVISKASQKALISSRNFRRKYAKAIMAVPENEAIFERFRQLILHAPEGFLMHFIRSIPKWFTGFTKDEWTRGISLENVTGSVPDRQTEAFLRSKKSLLMTKLQNSLTGVDNFDRLRAAVTTNFYPGLMQLEMLCDRLSISNLTKKREGRDWTDEEFEREIGNALLGIGVRNDTYLEAIMSFNSDLYGFMYGSDDIRDRSHDIAASLNEVNTYFTAKVDQDNDLDNVDLALAQKREADVTPAEKPEWERARTARMAHAFFLDTNKKILEITTANKNRFKHSVPAPSSSFWTRNGLQHWDAWKSNPANRVSGETLIDSRPVLDTIDDSKYVEYGTPAAAPTAEFIYRGSQAPANFRNWKNFIFALSRTSKLEEALIKKLRKAVADLVADKTSELRTNALNGWIKDLTQAKITFTTGESVHVPNNCADNSRGYDRLKRKLTAIAAIHNGTLPRIRSIQQPDIYTFAAALHDSLSEATITRSAQDALIDDRVNKFMRYIYADREKDQSTFWMNYSFSQQAKILGTRIFGARGILH